MMDWCKDGMHIGINSTTGKCLGCGGQLETTFNTNYYIEQIHRFDNTLYTFTHKDYGTVKCAQYQLYTSYPKSNLNKLVKKECKSTAGWSLYE